MRLFAEMSLVNSAYLDRVVVRQSTPSFASRQMFRLFGANPGHDLSVAAAAAFAGGTVPSARQLLDHLHQVSLLEEAVPERYHVLDPLKQSPNPCRPGKRDDALNRLLDFYLVNTAIETAFPFDQGQPSTGGVRIRWSRRPEGGVRVADSRAAEPGGRHPIRGRTRAVGPHLAAGRAAVAVLQRHQPHRRLDRRPSNWPNRP